MHVRSIRPIAKGEEITIPYVEIAAPYLIRKTELHQNFFFTCTCDVCRFQLNEPQLSWYKCSPSCKGHVAEDHPVCDQCKHTRTPKDFSKRENQRRAAEQVISGAQKLDSATKRASKLEEGIELLSAIFPPTNYKLLCTRKEVFDTYLNELSNFEEAAAHCREIVDVYQEIYPKHWPLIGVQLLMLAKLHRWLSVDAFDTARKALACLSISHGEDHPLTVDAATLVRECQLEKHGF